LLYVKDPLLNHSLLVFSARLSASSALACPFHCSGKKPFARSEIQDIESPEDLMTVTEFGHWCRRAVKQSDNSIRLFRV
jgi:hypothetical protein